MSTQPPAPPTVPLPAHVQQGMLVWSGRWITPAAGMRDGACVVDHWRHALASTPSPCKASGGFIECEKWGINMDKCQQMCAEQYLCHAYEWTKAATSSGSTYERCTLQVHPVTEMRHMAGYICRAKEKIEHIPMKLPIAPRIAQRQPFTGCGGSASLPPLNPPPSYFRKSVCTNLARPGVEFEVLGCTDLAFTDLRGANLKNAKLDNTDLCGALLDYANLRGAEIQGAKADGASFRNAAMEGAKLNGLEIRYADLSNTDLRGLDMQGVKAEMAAFTNSRMNYVDMSEAELTKADLRGTSLAGAWFQHTKVGGADFTGASGIIAADFANIDGVPIGFIDKFRAPTTTNWGGPGFVPPNWGATQNPASWANQPTG
mmetsp:Transcript_42437/g.70572  ORF Transcript_42437/g.70572 Transcript_42437/m.70572 type:complete len:373 (+) Transcript_42437:61-1179(+)|eukprot:CAMPEP_0119319624 /NCGR_PEP_ID=MMETSP1333-20130426/49899_1 /TAXON_ID=418940 /ORGANISM="Scyphosphaera apsteinii, Strain RCC1455" /LENGTH=372 /DNA_ID=CAMNT_0007326079 /DNA_START=61 /DNA_END=1179 /DNA_ORIENTATION=+